MAKRKTTIKIPSRDILDFSVRMALAEDVGPGDITTKLLIDKKFLAHGEVRAKEAGVIAGLPVAAEVFRQIDRRIKFFPKVKDGDKVKKGTVIARLSGPAQGLLTGERVALNFLQHLSGIATLTDKFVSRVAGRGSRAQILDTRKTVPGLRLLEKYAVAVGGGANHRLGLYDAILIKDNHLKIAGGIEKALRRVASRGSRVNKTEVEAKTIEEVRRAVALGVDRILLDNMSLKIMREAVKLCKKGGVKTEASGGVNLKNVAAIARTGVDYISVGALTHSAPALDINLKVD